LVFKLSSGKVERQKKSSKSSKSCLISLQVDYVPHSALQLKTKNPKLKTEMRQHCCLSQLISFIALRHAL